MAEMAGQQHISLSRGASEDIAALATGTDRNKVALDALTEAIRTKSLSAEQVALLRELAESAQEPKSTDDFATKVSDNKFSFRLAGPTTEQSREDYIRTRLQTSPDEAKCLITRLSNLGVDLSKTVSGPMKGFLRTDSNEKTLRQQRDFYEDGLADPVVGVAFAIEAVLQARKNGIRLETINNESLQAKGKRVYQAALAAKLSEGCATILKMLTHGVIRVEEKGSRPVALDVRGDGRLYAGESDVSAYAASRWALGGVAPAAE